MATPSSTPTFPALRAQLKKRNFLPVYLLHGEEGYYIDELVKDFEEIIPENERDFNLYTLYAPESGVETVMDVCRQYPMMSEYQVVIVKEAQAIRADSLNKLHNYVSQPTPTTILVIVCRGAQAKGKELLAAVKKNGVIFESKKLSDRNILPVISDLHKCLKSSHHRILWPLSGVWHEHLPLCECTTIHHRPHHNDPPKEGQLLRQNSLSDDMPVPLRFQR